MEPQHRESLQRLFDYLETKGRLLFAQAVGSGRSKSRLKCYSVNGGKLLVVQIFDDGQGWEVLTPIAHSARVEDTMAAVYAYCGDTVKLSTAVSALAELVAASLIGKPARVEIDPVTQRIREFELLDGAPPREPASKKRRRARGHYQKHDAALQAETENIASGNAQS